MQFQKTLIALFIVFSFTKINAQKFELGKVSLAELEEKEHPKEPSAGAAILFKKGEVRFEYSQSDGFVIFTVVKTRIKIYKKEGYDQANQAVGYYLGSNFKESVLFSDAVTYNLVAGKIEKTKLKSDGQFDEKINKYWGQKKITMPNIKEGSIIEFEYTIESPSIGSLKDWSFQSNIPVNFSEFKTYIPEYFIYNPSQKGFFFPKVSIEKSNKTVSYTYRDGNQPREAFIHSTSQEKLEYIETQTTYLTENLPSMKEEAYVNNIDNYTSSVSHELSLIRYPNSPFEKYATDWETVTKKIYEYEDFGDELKKTGYFEDDVNSLMVGLTSDQEKIYTLYNFVKNRIKWNNLYNYYCHDGVKKAYKDKTGNVAEINLMLTAMLRYVGIEANPVLVSTRSNGIALFPNRTAFNYVISAVEIQDGLILLDATEKYAIPNVLPLRDLNWYGRLIRKEGSSTQVDLMPKILSKEAVNMNLILKADGTIEGKIRKQYSDHLALSYRQNNLLTNKDTYLESLENKSNAIEINDYVRENDLELLNPIVESYSFKDNKSIEILNGKIYLAPLLFLTTIENPFKQEVRAYPVDFGYPIEKKFNINIEIPEGYVVESLPSPVNVTANEISGVFKYVIGAVDNKIQIQVTMANAIAIIPADFYEVLKEFYQMMVEKQNAKIILIKKI